MSTKVVICYDPADGEHGHALEKHLATLKRQNLIESWRTGQVSAGSPVDAVVVQRIDEADLILLLVSSDFLASAHCYEVQLRRALDRHQRGEVRVIPILTRACVYAGESFAKLQVLPRNGIPITSWPIRDEAWTDVTTGIREALTGSAGSPEQEDEVAPSPFDNPLCGKIMEELLEGYKTSGFPPVGCWSFCPGDGDEMLAFLELAARGYIRQFSHDTFYLDYLGHTLIMQNIPMSKAAKEFLAATRTAYIAAGYPPHRVWAFSPDKEEEMTAFHELQARGLIEIWTTTSWLLTDAGRDAILALR